MLVGACGCSDISEMNPIAASSRGISRPKAILFDWDNTLVDSWATIHEALNFLMTAMERPLWTVEETRERVRLSLREAFPQIFADRWHEADHLGWSALFGSVIGAGDAPVDKPDAAPVRLALAQSGIVPGEAVWFV